MEEKQTSLRWICTVFKLRVLGPSVYLPQRPGRADPTSQDPRLFCHTCGRRIKTLQRRRKDRIPRHVRTTIKWRQWTGGGVAARVFGEQWVPMAGRGEATDFWSAGAC